MWHPVKEYIEKTLKVNQKKEKVYLDEFHKEDLEEILEQQYKNASIKKTISLEQKLFATFVVVDDFVYQVSFSKHNSMLNALYTRCINCGVNVVSYLKSSIPYQQSSGQIANNCIFSK